MWTIRNINLSRPKPLRPLMNRRRNRWNTAIDSIPAIVTLETKGSSGSRYWQRNQIILPNKSLIVGQTDWYSVFLIEVHTLYKIRNLFIKKRKLAWDQKYYESTWLIMNYICDLSKRVCDKRMSRCVNGNNFIQNFSPMENRRFIISQAVNFLDHQFNFDIQNKSNLAYLLMLFLGACFLYSGHIILKPLNNWINFSYV